MKKERSAGAIIARREKKGYVYLLLHYPSSVRAKKEYWDLPKGHIELGETEVEAAKREVAEETGLKNIVLHKDFRHRIHYWFQWEGEKISKTVTFYLGETGKKEIIISDEHIGFAWLSYKEALQKLTYENAKKVLRKAHLLVSRVGVSGGKEYPERGGSDV